MAWLDHFLLAETHRETYAAILKSYVPHGKRGEFARRAGLTPEYLSYLCALDRPAIDRYPIKRSPSPQMIEKIAAALPAPLEIRRSLIENMQLSHVNAARSYYATRRYTSERRITELLSEIGQAHWRATFGTALPEVKRDYRIVRDSAASLQLQLNPAIYPASFAQACLYLHDAQCILDRADDALRYAKLARMTLENRDSDEPGYDKEQVDRFEINAIRGEAVAYHNLGLDREASGLLQQCRETAAYRNAGDFWRPLVGRDLLNAMALIPRASIREANRIAGEIEAICERKGDEFTLFLGRESWLRSLIWSTRWKQAGRVYQEETERLSRLPYAGALHRALFYKSGALLAWELGDRETWLYRVKGALRLMQDAGLDHQARLVEQQYGPTLAPVFEELGYTVPA